jgi:protein O-mannosyl-transferase
MRRARTQRPSAGKHRLALAVGLLMAVLCAYRPAWNGLPVWDDDGHMTKPELRSAAGLVRIWSEVGATQQYYPLVHTVFWVEHRLFGDWTPGYHVLSILLHGVSALLLVAILRRLGLPGAWLAGWIFALHPVMVESVAWITELKNTLSGVFFLGAGLAYLEFDERRARKPYAVALALFFAGLLAKSVIVTLPAALLVVFWWQRGRLGWKRDVLPLLPFFIVGACAGLVTAWVERRFIGAVGSEWSFTFLDRCLIAGRAVWFYLVKLLFPARLVFIYPRWHIDATAAWQYLPPLALVLAVAVAYRLRHRSRAPLAVLLYFGATLFPSLGFFDIYPFRYSFVADHFQYLAAIGPITAAATWIERGAGRLAETREGMRTRRRVPYRPYGRLAAKLFPGFLLSVLFLLSWRQSGMYADAATLYRTTIERNPDCWMAHYNLGILLAEEGRSEEAKDHYLKALAQNPQHAKAHINLGILLAKTGQTEQALGHYQQALAISPGSAEAHYNLGFLLVATGRIREGEAHYLQALAIHPRHADAHNNLGILLADTGRPDEALAHYLKALEIKPIDHEIHNNLGILLAKLGRTDEALAHFQKAVALHPRYAEAQNNLGISLAKTGRADEAIASYQAALAINPGYAEAHNNLGILLAGTGRADEAIAHFIKALRTSPGELGTLKNLAFALLQKGRGAEATSLLQNALARARAAGDVQRAGMLAQLVQKLQAAMDASRRNAD